MEFLLNNYIEILALVSALIGSWYGFKAMSEEKTRIGIVIDFTESKNFPLYGKVFYTQIQFQDAMMASMMKVRKKLRGVVIDFYCRDEYGKECLSEAAKKSDYIFQILGMPYNKRFQGIEILARDEGSLLFDSLKNAIDVEIAGDSNYLRAKELYDPRADKFDKINCGKPSYMISIGYLDGIQEKDHVYDTLDRLSEVVVKSAIKHFKESKDA